MVTEKLISAVIIIAALVFFVLYLLKVGVSAAFIAESSECKTSIITHTALLKATDEELTPDIYCPTQYYEIPSRNQEKIKQHIAESMRACWGTWGKGQLQLFKKEGYLCHMCSVMEFKHKNKEIPGLLDYMANTHISKGSGEGLTYLDFLSGYSTNPTSANFVQNVKQQSATQTIDTSKTYATMFLYAKGEDSMNKLFENLEAYYQKKPSTLGTSALIGSAGGAAAGIVTVAIIGTGGAAAVIIGAGALLGAGIAAIIDALDNHGAEWTAMIMFDEYDAETLKQIGCERSEVRQDKQRDALG